MRLSDSWFPLIFRLVVVAILVLIGFWIAMNYALLFAYPFWVLAGILVAFPLAELLVRPFAGFLLPTDRYSKPQPMYSIPQSRRMQNDLEGALAEYRKIAANYPRELRVYQEMIRLAYVDMKDGGLAASILEQGLASLRKKDLKAELRRDYEAITTMSQTPPTAEMRRKVAYRKSSGEEEVV